MVTKAGQRLDGQTVVITGASDGIGRVAAVDLAGRGARVLVVGRSPEKTRAVAAEVGSEAFVADFASLAQVKQLADELAAATDHIDILMNNAGGTFNPGQLTADGLEPNLQINHLAPFALTNLLKPLLGGERASKVITTASVANLVGRVDPANLGTQKPSEPVAYGSSKLMNIMFALTAHRRWQHENISSAAVHPGPAATSFGRDEPLIGLLYRTPLKHVLAINPERGAAPLIRLAAELDGAEIGGHYFHRAKRDGRARKVATDPAVGEALWEASAALVHRFI